MLERARTAGSMANQQMARQFFEYFDTFGQISLKLHDRSELLQRLLATSAQDANVAKRSVIEPSSCQRRTLGKPGSAIAFLQN